MIKQILDLYAAFRKDEGGQFAVIFALMALPVIALSGSIVDYARVEHDRNKLQAAVDAAALAVWSKDVGTTSNMSERHANARSITKTLLDSNASSLMGTHGAPSINFAERASSVQIDLQGHVETPFLSLVGIRQLSFRVAAAATAVSIGPYARSL